jgi:hypothetical protein
LDNLIYDIEVTRNGHLGTGILGTNLLINVLPNEERRYSSQGGNQNNISKLGVIGLKTEPLHFGKAGMLKVLTITRCLEP